MIRFVAQRLKAKAGSVEAAFNKLIPCGTFHRADFPGGRIVIDAAYLETMVSNWKAAGSPELPIDFFHRGESENDGLPTEDKVAAGWISSLEVRADGLYGETKWNAKAKAHIEADELRYFSPTFYPDGISQATGERQGPTLLGGALLNDPYFKELPRLAASEISTTKKDTAMDKIKLAALLIIAADTATEDTIEARIKALVDVEKKAEAEKVRASATSSALQEQLKAASGRIEALEAEGLKRETEALVAKLVTERRVKPANAEGVRNLVKKVGLKDAAELCALWPQDNSIPTGEKGVQGAPEGGGDAHSQLKALHAEKVKAGMSATQAWKALAREQPELTEKANANLTAAPRN